MKNVICPHLPLLFAPQSAGLYLRRQLHQFGQTKKMPHLD
jgi:hypothetical protein